MTKSESFWQDYMKLELEVLKLEKKYYFTETSIKVKNGKEYREPRTGDLETYTGRITNLFLQCRYKIDQISKELYFVHGGLKSRDDASLRLDTDCLTFLNKKWRICDKKVLFIATDFDLFNDENRILQPLFEAEFHIISAYGNNEYPEYQYHQDRTLHLPNFKDVIHGLAALFLLNIYLKDEKFTTTLSKVEELNMTFGSKLFSLEKPKVGKIWFGKIKNPGSCPYIVKYDGETYKKIQDLQNKGKNNVIEYFKKQPELKEEEFQKLLLNAEKDVEVDLNNDFSLLYELFLYRLKKNIPSSLPYLERKNLLLNSLEWTAYVKEKPLSEQRLTEKNIDEEIKKAAQFFAFQLKLFFFDDWFEFVFKESFCDVLVDKGKVIDEIA